MTLEECYEKIGGDYGDVLTRLDSRELVLKYLRRVPDDGSYEKLRSAMRNRRVKEAFLAAHTLKGFALTMGLPGLVEWSGRLTEKLREGEAYDEADNMFGKLSAEFCRVAGLIRELDEPEPPAENL